MIEGRRRLRLPLEASHAVNIQCEFGWEELDCDLSIESRILGKMDLAHTAGANLPQKIVRTEIIIAAGRDCHFDGSLVGRILS
jgi:hypothetical protein